MRAGDLQPALVRARRAVSAPIRLEQGETWWRLRPRRIAQLLSLPHDGSTDVEIGGPGAERWFARFGKTVGRPPTDARFVVAAGGSVAILPHKQGVQLDVERTRAELLRAVLAPRRRVANVSVTTKAPEFTTAEARALGISTVLASFSTFYSGTADRIRNLQLAVSLLDGTLVAPGQDFSLNEAVGPRTLERGFRVAPVIIGGEYEEDVGGGVSQVATTVFNAAWEAGLKLVARAPHSLYISRYPLGRDATVNYPDLDLKFRNDTGRWLVVLGASGRDGIAITIAGAPTGRRVESSAGPLEVTGPVPIQRVPDPELLVGSKVVEESRVACALGHRRADGVRPRRGRPLRRDLAHELPRREARRPRRDEAEARGAQAADDEHADDDQPDDDHADDAQAEPAAPPPPPSPLALRLAGSRRTSQAGTRVGRSVRASTQAWCVSPSATRVPSRSSS